MANDITFAILLLFPLVILWRSFYITTWWLKIPLIACLVPITVISFLMQVFIVFDLSINEGSIDNSFRPSRQFAINNSSLVQYTQNTRDSFGVVVRQERRLIPGILLVRELYREMPWMRHCNYIEPAGNEAIRIVMVEKTDNELIIPIKRFIWF